MGTDIPRYSFLFFFKKCEPTGAPVELGLNDLTHGKQGLGVAKCLQLFNFTSNLQHQFQAFVGILSTLPRGIVLWVLL